MTDDHADIPIDDQGPAEACYATLPESAQAPLPVWLIDEIVCSGGLTHIERRARDWLGAIGFTGAAKRAALLQTEDGSPGGAAFGIGTGLTGEPSGPPELLVGQLAQTLPPATYRIENAQRPDVAALAWGLGAYRYGRYKSAPRNAGPKLVISDNVDVARVVNTVEAVWLGRDLINTPASDMGPEELEGAARALARRHGAEVASVVGDDLIARNFPLIHAVGRASPRAPRLIDLTWGREEAPRITLIGKGICFDTGGLDIKPSAGMLLMKKDMGGAATALALAHMIMGQRLPVRMRLLIPAAENSIAGNAFRPGDVIRSRAGPTVEIGNTDAEGRLVLADALALADETGDAGSLFVFATLTGAARVALGPDLPALFTDDDPLAATLTAVSHEIGDPVWRMPLFRGYERNLESETADMNNVSDGPFAGAITAALFLRRFVRNAARFAHIDLYGWRLQPRPLGPKGGEPQSARAVFEVLKSEYPS